MRLATKRYSLELVRLSPDGEPDMGFGSYFSVIQAIFLHLSIKGGSADA